MNGGSSSATQDSATEAARYERAVQAAHRRLELAEQRKTVATVVYVVVAVWSSMALWSWALNAPLRGVWILVGWSLLFGTVAGVVVGAGCGVAAGSRDTSPPPPGEAVMTFLAGMLGGMVPGLIFGTVLFTVAGWFVARDSYCRHRYSEPAPQPMAASGPVRVAADRVPAPPPVLVNVFIPGLPQPAPAMWPGVVEGQVIHELPPARWGNN